MKKSITLTLCSIVALAQCENIKVDEIKEISLSELHTGTPPIPKWHAPAKLIGSTTEKIMEVEEAHNIWIKCIKRIN